MAKYGFTGTSKGMTGAQQRGLCFLLGSIYRLGDELHHGVCIGSDQQAHRIACFYGYTLHGHPGFDPKHIEDKRFRSDCCSCDKVYPAAPFLVRNQHIVMDAVRLFATPKEYKMVRRSGTWATVRYALKLNIPVTVIWPDGQIGEYLNP